MFYQYQNHKVSAGLLSLFMAFNTNANAKRLATESSNTKAELPSHTQSHNQIKSVYDIEFEVGAKLVNKTVKGIGTAHFDVRPYLQLGAYRQQSPTLKMGTALNFAPNILSSDTPALLNFKVLDVHYQLNGEHSLSAYAGALRQARKYTAWGYSIGIGYGTSIWGYQVKTNISWARTNTDIGGLAAETGAKDNIVWINIGVRF